MEGSCERESVDRLITFRQSDWRSLLTFGAGAPWKISTVSPFKTSHRQTLLRKPDIESFTGNKFGNKSTTVRAASMQHIVSTIFRRIFGFCIALYPRYSERICFVCRFKLYSIICLLQKEGKCRQPTRKLNTVHSFGLGGTLQRLSYRKA